MKTASQLLAETKDCIDSARKNLALLTTNQVPGADNYHVDYQHRLRTVLAYMQSSHDIINNHAIEP